MIQISDLVLEFRDFILVSWPSLEKLDSSYRICCCKNNCIEALWELILEPALTIKLETRVYIQEYWLEGAEMYSNSPRAFFPDVKEPTHEIFCLPKNNEFFSSLLRKKKSS